MDNENKSLAQKMSEADLPPHYRVYAAMGAIQGILEINGIECKGSAPEDVYETVKELAEQHAPSECEAAAPTHAAARVNRLMDRDACNAFDDIAYLRKVSREQLVQWGVMLRESPHWTLLPGAQVLANGKRWTYTPSGWVTYSQGNETRTITWGCCQKDADEVYQPLVNYAGACGHLLHLLRSRYNDNTITSQHCQDGLWRVWPNGLGEVDCHVGFSEVEALVLALTA
jgi:hypothetical protein